MMYGASDRLAAPDPKLSVDACLWDLVRESHPTRWRHDLTAAGFDRAAVVSGCPSGGWAALSALAVRGGAMRLEWHDGRRWVADAAALAHADGIDLLRLAREPLATVDRSTTEVVARLTSDGRGAYLRAKEEHARLLARVRKAHPFAEPLGGGGAPQPGGAHAP